MGRMYAMTFENVSVTGSQDLFEIAPADDKPVLVHSIYVSQASDTGDAAEEMLRIKLIRGHTTGGSGGSTVTARPLQSTVGAAAGATCKVNNTTIAAAGSPVDLHAESFNIRSGWAFIPTPEARPGASQADGTLVVRLMNIPADALTMAGTIIFEELG